MSEGRDGRGVKIWQNGREDKEGNGCRREWAMEEKAWIRDGSGIKGARILESGGRIGVKLSER